MKLIYWLLFLRALTLDFPDILYIYKVLASKVMILEKMFLMNFIDNQHSPIYICHNIIEVKLKLSKHVFKLAFKTRMDICLAGSTVDYQRLPAHLQQ